MNEPSPTPQIIGCAPPRYRHNRWSLRYSVAHHGISLKTLYRHVDDLRGTIVLIRDNAGRVFGGYNTESWKARGSGGSNTGYYGTGESFCFAFEPELKRYAWSGENQFFMSSSLEGLGMGGGSAFAWYIDKDILDGTSGACNTFNSPQLSGMPDFQVVHFELWASD